MKKEKESIPIRRCKVCGNIKIPHITTSERFCDCCGIETPSMVYVTLTETIGLVDTLFIKHKSSRYKRFATMIWSGWFKSNKYEHGVDIDRRIDKVNNEYHELVRDNKTNVIVHEVHEKLTDHIGHGSAKTK